MKILYFSLFILLNIMISTSAVHASPEVGGGITRLYINKSGLVMFNLDFASSPSGCLTGSYQFEFLTQDTVGQEWVSLLLSSKALAKTIGVGYTDAGGPRCSVDYIYTLD